jgi:curved DNA-binding protein CbpA
VFDECDAAAGREVLRFGDLVRHTLPSLLHPIVFDPRNLARDWTLMSEPKSTPRDCYDILGVSRSASAADIDRAYEDTLRRIQGRAPPGSPTRVRETKEAFEAYEILSDPEKRSRYDRFGRWFASVAESSSAGSSPDFGNIFEGLFGPTPKREPSQPEPASPPVVQTPKFEAISKAEMERLSQVLVRAVTERLLPQDELDRLRAGFFVRDDRGTAWSFGLKTRQWNRRDGQRWVPDTPSERLSMASEVLGQLRALGRSAP